jgi:Pyruvate/2-oxoacid:ferredoxin oxidoreductase delta subunit
MEYPEVLQETCTGCGVCVVICPMETIVMENGKARIETEKCQACRICVSVCESKAIV